MLYAPEAQQQITEHFQSEIHEFQTIARMHGIATGIPECLTALPLRLSQDWRLRSDFVEMIHALQRREADLSLPDAVAVLTTAVGGPSALNLTLVGRSAISPALDEALNLTAGFLASLGGWSGSDVDPITDLDNPSDHDPRLDLAAEADAYLPESAPERSAVPATPPDDQPLDLDPTDAATLAIITQALARLERGNLDLRLHLDSIDQRISRMEPLLESAPHASSPDAVAPEPSPDQLSRPYASPEMIKPAPEPARRPPAPPARMSIAASEPNLVHRTSAPLASSAPPPDSPQTPHIGRRLALDLSDGVHPTNSLSPTASPSPVPPLPPANAPSPRPPSEPAAGPPNPPIPQSPERERAPGPASTAPLPRRDRFAAARELPGSHFERSDPFHPIAEKLAADPTTDDLEVAPPSNPAPASDQDLTRISPSAGRSSRRAVAYTVADPAEFASAPDSSAAARPPSQPAPRPDSQPNAPHRAVTPPQQPRPQQAAAQTISPAAPIPSNLMPATPANVAAIAGLDLSSPRQPATSADADLDRAETDAPVKRSSNRGTILVGLASALIVGAAGFLLVRGTPLNLTHANGAAHPPVVSTSVRSAPAADSTVAQPTVSAPANGLIDPTTSAPRSAPRPASSPAASDRLHESPTAPGSSDRAEITAAPIFVPEVTMDGLLLSAPHPTYPAQASLAGVRGTVVFSVMVSKEGNVEALKSIGGSHLLQEAAATAVRRWQFRPYMLRGRPVEVRTVVRVDVEPRPVIPSAQ